MFLVFFLLWVIYNANFTLEIAVFGVVIAGAMLAFVCKFMDYSLQKEIRIYKKIPLFLRYVVLLVREIIKANMGVVKLILTQKEEVDPVLVSFETDLQTGPGKMLLANAITLTPGTITVSLEENRYVVHCLDESLSEGMEDSDFVKRIHELEQ